MQVPDFDLFHPGAEPGWQIVASERKFDNPHVSVDLNHYLTPGRPDKPQPWMVVGRKAAVAVAPRLVDGRFVLIAQERLPVRQTMWEFPAGQIDDETHCESIVTTVLNELREEAGLALAPEAGKLTPLGWFFPSQGFTDEHVYLFHAEPVCVVSQPEPEGSEHISSVRFVSAGELRRMIAENEITNALSLALFARMAAKGLL
ncbi:MAG: NUDIX hydrolase [Verrucomicrobiaceae bacterium]|jgi:8-oxo-dGTP pyrophosphatase MutT (NUDIX family)|nr:NUDIX hydrolase [Verrucomicrobiaceae bacterium]